MLQNLQQQLIDLPEDFVGSTILFELFDTSKIAAVPTAATAFPNRHIYMNGSVVMRWTRADLDAESRTKALAMAASVGSARIYPNYGDASASRAPAMFGPNYARLQRLKAKYDPDKVFHRWYCIEPVHLQDTEKVRRPRFPLTSDAYSHSVGLVRTTFGVSVQLCRDYDNMPR